MFEQAFKNIDDELRKDAGCSSELDYIEQTSWILFLKYLSDLEKTKEDEASLQGNSYQPILAQNFQWENWAVPKTTEGEIDHQKTKTGEDLKNFVDTELFPYLKEFSNQQANPNTIQYKIGEIFNELKNKIQSGYVLGEIINSIDQLSFQKKAEKDEMSHLYEGKIKNMGNAGRNGGEYYTPRPLIQCIIKVVAPKIGERVYDGAVGSAGFLCEAYNYLRNNPNLSTEDLETIQKKTFFGKEKKSLAYIIGIMNMILHGIETPNIIHKNTLSENIREIEEKDRYDIILTNPPFGGSERKEIQSNFDIETGETAFLFLQHFSKILKAGGRAGIVIKNTFLSNTDNASVSLRKELLENCDLHTILDLPSGVFQGAGVKTIVLFFDKGKPSKKIWYYQLNLKRNLGKTNPLNEEDLSEFITLQKTKADSLNSWQINAKDIEQKTFDLSAKNPNTPKEDPIRQPQEILAEIKILDKNTDELFTQIKELNL